MRRATSVARTLEIGADHGVPIGLGLLGRELLDRDAGIVDQHRDGTERRFRRIDGLRDGCGVGDVERDGGGAAAVAADLLFQILQLVGLPCRERDGRAVRRQHPGKLPPQPLAGTGDEDGFFTDVE
jgi:hypothetical protein